MSHDPDRHNDVSVSLNSASQLLKESAMTIFRTCEDVFACLLQHLSLEAML